MRGWVWGKIFPHTAEDSCSKSWSATASNQCKYFMPFPLLSEPSFFRVSFHRKWWSEGRTICGTFFVVWFTTNFAPQNHPARLTCNQQAMGDMTAVMGNRQDALEVGKQAMDRVARSPYVSAVPQCYPVPLIEATIPFVVFLIQPKGTKVWST